MRSARLEEHLLGAFGEQLLTEITIADVERYAAAKLKAGKLSPRSIDATITLLAQILDAALDRELIGRNVARGRGRKVRERAPARTYLETAGQIEALLDAAGRLDRGPRGSPARRAPRDDRHADLRRPADRELCALRWRDVDLAAGWLRVGESKTDASKRRVKIRGALRDELLAVRAKLDGVEQDAHVFATRNGKRPSGANIRARVLNAAVVSANADLAKRDLPPLPDKLTPHSLRRTFCSLLYALGETPPAVMQDMGHADPGLALRVYAQAMRRGERETAALRALAEGGGLGRRPKPARNSRKLGATRGV
jgi:integrase